MSGKGDQVLLKPEGFSAHSNERKFNDNIPHEGRGRMALKMEMASHCPRVASVKALSTCHKLVSPKETEAAEGGKGNKEEQTKKQTKK